MLLQVHDELVFDAHQDEVEIIKPIIIGCMQTPCSYPTSSGRSRNRFWR